ncbi:uncharacterized protein TNCV_1033191 [Trichonephila clavipes]|nr:uncharacterized protein TNCV_1033191 [Trichonephila clavipes]
MYKGFKHGRARRNRGRIKKYFKKCFSSHVEKRGHRSRYQKSGESPDMADPSRALMLSFSRAPHPQPRGPGEANPQVYVETPLHPEKLTVYDCALYGLVECFFKNDEGHNVTVNGDRYSAIIANIFIPELNNQDVQELWFQQDGATCHTARATIDLLKDTFGVTA